MKKTFLMLEVFICFAPALLMLLLGVALAPMQLMYLLQEPVLWEGPVMVLAMVSAGMLGLVTLTFVLSQLMAREGAIRSPLLVLTGAIVGVAPLVPYALSGSAPFMLLGLLPIACAVHILHLARHMLSPLRRPSNRRIKLRLAAPVLVAMIAGVAYVSLDSMYLSEEEIDEQRAAWIRRKPQLYSYELHPGGYIDGRVRHPMRIEVNGSRVVAHADLSTPTPGIPLVPAPQNELAWSMDDVFDAMSDAVREGAQVRAAFDDDFGYARKVYVDAEAENAGWMLDVHKFKPATP